MPRAWPVGRAIRRIVRDLGSLQVYPRNGCEPKGAMREPHWAQSQRWISGSKPLDCVVGRQDFSQFPLQEFAVRIPWQRVIQEPDIPWNLMLGHKPCAVSPDLVCAAAGAGVQVNGRADFFAQAIIGHAKDTAFRDGVDLKEYGLNL